MKLLQELLVALIPSGSPRKTICGTPRDINISTPRRTPNSCWNCREKLPVELARELPAEKFTVEPQEGLSMELLEDSMMRLLWELAVILLLQF